ncbi:hypothetical protein A3H80_00845 [Candidatus Roizmanbacteria bacterium RIFCSPLOWO2_02_FULL_37_19]|uniref:Cyclic nucleotide-binding domain-containing protein n=1 Tax=Candidatus Roizmanbacteria bacterium RIFCSPHIGHO2_02_FULL_37_24 TaxID=1802037 RepID=A0A1F7GW30_9BACT|nr:MAG: hypothetical protein A3C24_00650 [Candidatus Roizmanbacteria bacterium RIFCSPHIGHO2_02_FULL_37_24]OGK32532.1 MAG: hypothetical protein A3E10_00715 [Candidatus Roizmanbacteria bacterium RIFCSPHIGHO2_12_FULL_37_23]OGK43736.1 MAG: hypothetical protein A2956_01415 [Candidatus Roizmanbacteria bacterium RIFCSPLOWO2_01_FULL_37_57]OGK54512.1 MAG: hypothetical protein A3H80_00845 [Candidatus Roizmanbacteria bacterium RIFCSPLOWO2_02_FULL_37_19]
MLDKKSSLREQDILRNLPENILVKVSEVAKLKTFFQGDVLMCEGDDSKDIQFITKGIVAVYSLLEDGTIVPITLLHKGQSVGELGVVTDKTRSATVEALSDVETLVISRDDFKAILKSDPALMQELLKDLSGRIQKENNLLLIQKTKHLPEKVWILLQELSHFFENKTINVSHERLAQLVGVTRPRLTEALHTLVDEKKIKLSFNNITVI